MCTNPLFCLSCIITEHYTNFNLNTVYLEVYFCASVLHGLIMVEACHYMSHDHTHTHAHKGAKSYQMPLMKLSPVELACLPSKMKDN